MRRDSLRNEAPYVPDPEAVEALANLHQRLVDAGQSAQVASGIISWLITKSAGTDATNSATRARYRKILADLEPTLAPPPERPPRHLEAVAGDRKGPRKRARGTGKLASVVALALVSVGAGTQAQAPTVSREQVDRTEHHVDSRRKRKAA